MKQKKNCCKSLFSELAAVLVFCVSRIRQRVRSVWIWRLCKQTCFFDANTLELLDGPLDRVNLGTVRHPAVIAYLKKKEEKSLAHILPYRQDRRAATLKDGRKIAESVPGTKQALF